MKKINFQKLLLIVLALSFFSGCVSVNQSFRQLRKNILSKIDGDFSKQVEISLGPGTMFLASMATSFIDADDRDNIDISAMINKIDRVQVSVYENNSGEVKVPKGMTANISREMQDAGWDRMVRVQDREEISLVFVRGESEEKLNQMFVIAVNNSEFVMTEIRGDLSGLIGVVMKDKGLKMQIAGT